MFSNHDLANRVVTGRARGRRSAATGAPVPLAMVAALLAAVVGYAGYAFYVRRVEARAATELGHPCGRELGAGLLLGGVREEDERDARGRHTNRAGVRVLVARHGGDVLVALEAAIDLEAAPKSLRDDARSVRGQGRETGFEHRPVLPR